MPIIAPVEATGVKGCSKKQGAASRLGVVISGDSERIMMVYSPADDESEGIWSRNGLAGVGKCGTSSVGTSLTQIENTARALNLFSSLLNSEN